MTSVELFSGCGGLAKGLELAGFRSLAFVEINKWACESLRHNFSPGLVYETDVRNFSFSGFPPVALVAGGPPCQPFSLGGLARSYNDVRDMFPQAARAIRELRPQAFVFENVKGLLRENFSQYFQYIIDRLSYPDNIEVEGERWQDHAARLREVSLLGGDGLKYRVTFKLLNAADFGVPQNRERVFIVGIRSDIDAKWLWPSTICEPDRRKTIREAIRHLPDPRLQHHQWVDHYFIDGARVYPGHTGSDVNAPSKTIKAGAHGVPGGENMIRFEDGSVRYMTVHEAKVIQTFPDEYVISGTWGEAMRQIGNAVPVKLATLLGCQMKALLEPHQGRIGIPEHDGTVVFSGAGNMRQLSFFDLVSEADSMYVVHESPITLAGTYRKICRSWIVAKNLYNYPVTDEELDAHPELLSVRRLVLVRRNDKTLHFLVKGYSIETKEKLEKLGYPGNKKHAAKTQYILYRLQLLPEETPAFNSSQVRLVLGAGCNM